MPPPLPQPWYAPHPPPHPISSNPFPRQNTTFNSALKQSTLIRRDLSTLTTSPTPLTPSSLGALSASLTAFARTIDEYQSLAKQEPVAPKQEKAHERIRNFRAELADFRSQLDTLKSTRDDAAHAQNRAELLGRRPFQTATPENPYASSASAGGGTSGYGYGGSGGGHARSGSTAEGGGGYEMAERESHAMREQQFFSSTHSALDDYIARGQAVLGDLNQQREMLKSTQRRLYSVGNTLGISGDTIRMIERRARQDKWIFWAGVVVFFGFCWLVVRYLR